MNICIPWIPTSSGKLQYVVTGMAFLLFTCTYQSFSGHFLVHFCQWILNCLYHSSWMCSASLWHISTEMKIPGSLLYHYCLCQTFLQNSHSRTWLTQKFHRSLIRAFIKSKSNNSKEILTHQSSVLQFLD